MCAHQRKPFLWLFIFAFAFPQAARAQDVVEVEYHRARNVFSHGFVGARLGAPCEVVAAREESSPCRREGVRRDAVGHGRDGAKHRAHAERWARLDAAPLGVADPTGPLEFELGRPPLVENADVDHAESSQRFSNHCESVLEAARRPPRTPGGTQQEPPLPLPHHTHGTWPFPGCSPAGIAPPLGSM